MLISKRSTAKQKFYTYYDQLTSDCRKVFRPGIHLAFVTYRPYKGTGETVEVLLANLRQIFGQYDYVVVIEAASLKDGLKYDPTLYMDYHAHLIMRMDDFLELKRGLILKPKKGGLNIHYRHIGDYEETKKYISKDFGIPPVTHWGKKVAKRKRTTQKPLFLNFPSISEPYDPTPL